jgi:mannose-1-phosphate guanylyltransferase/mannose-6-phosphate isomerase
MAEQIFPVILSGGSGSRLWPLSRRSYPKQFLALSGPLTLFQATAERVRGAGFAPVTVVASDEHRFLAGEQLQARGLAPRRLIIEPVARNTAPAVAVALLDIAEAAPDGLALVLPSDHVIGKAKAFQAAIAAAARQAARGHLMTFGIAPTRPDTGYGYIEQGAALDGSASVIQRFTEKPDRATAEGFLASGRYLWNSGMFLLPVRQTLAAFERHAPAVLAAARQARERAARDLDFLRLDQAALAAAPALSFDVAIMEKVSDAGVVPCEIGWSDIGAWDALWQLGQRDEDGNVLVGAAVAEGARNCYLRSESRLVTALGVEDLIVVETDTAVLVAPVAQAQRVKELVERLQREGRSEANEHARVLRPWGFYRSISVGERWQVKHISVKPGASLSLQMHHHRAEHWVVVSGTARTTRGEEVSLIHENESIYIPAGEKHRLENPGKVPLDLIEVQTGSYLGEDDIVRFSDNYGRVT